MKQLILLLAFSFAISSLGQNKTQNDLIGIYQSQNNKFLKWSYMILKEDGKFIYKYGLSACQAEITGTYIVEKNMICFKNDPEFINKKLGEFSPTYPDMSLTKWKIKKHFIKPEGHVDSGCIQENGKHFKK